jgi:hypothetical protein
MAIVKSQTPYISAVKEHVMENTKRKARSNTLAEIPEDWQGFLPETQHALLAVQKKGGQALAQQVAEAITAEIERSQKQQATERTALLITVMEGGEEFGYPQILTALFEVAQGLEAWAAFTTEASIEELRLLRDAIGLRRQSLAGRKRLKSL